MIIKKEDVTGKISRRKIILKSTALLASLYVVPKNVFGKSEQHSKNTKVTATKSSDAVDSFITDDFLLYNKTAKTLYHEYAKSLPIIDYHCHLSPFEISSNKKFKSLTEIWLEGDHYKMRAMRANGVKEKYITGDAPDFEKFMKWAETVPFTIMNPLYHWTHLELKRYFGIDKILNPSSAKEIYDKATSLLQTEEYRAQKLLKRMNVEVICTSDDPVDSLEYHQQSKNIGMKVLPAWRPDKVMAIDNPEVYNKYLDQLAKVCGMNIIKYQDLIGALKKRQQLFNSTGCKLSDHGMETFYAEEYTEAEIDAIFQKLRSGNTLTTAEILKIKSSLISQLAEMNHDLGWTQQFHIGPIRNNNSKMLALLGPNTGYDSMGDFSMARGMSKFFDNLDRKNRLTKTIVYNVNPRDNEMMVTMMGNFNDGDTPGKMQYGPAWWFLDQKNGIEAQLNALANMGLLGRFIGMTTDSRSFLSFTRHEYFRRIICNLMGSLVELGELPSEMKLLEETVKNICYYNAKQYFNF